jgi:hypothetical protein
MVDSSTRVPSSNGPIRLIVSQTIYAIPFSKSFPAMVEKKLILSILLVVLCHEIRTVRSLHHSILPNLYTDLHNQYLQEGDRARQLPYPAKMFEQCLDHFNQTGCETMWNQVFELRFIT